MSIYRRRAGKIMHHDTAKAEVGLLAFSVLMVMVGGIRCLRLGLSVSISAHNLPRADQLRWRLPSTRHAPPPGRRAMCSRAGQAVCERDE